MFMKQIRINMGMVMLSWSFVKPELSNDPLIASFNKYVYRFDKHTSFKYRFND